jgi:hypothetical protein
VLVGLGRNTAARTGRLSPAGLEDFFMAIGVQVAGRTTRPPKADAASVAAFKEKSEALAPKYRTEVLKQA